MRDYAQIQSLLLADLSQYGHPGFISSEMSHEACAAYMLRASFFKKLAPVGPVESADKAALVKFLSINERIPDKFDFSASSMVESYLLDYFIEEVQHTLCHDNSDPVNFDFEFIRNHFDGGPGASRGCNSESFYTKFFESRITYTHPYLLSLYRAVISASPTWSSAERHRDGKFGSRLIEGNSLFFVPKTAEISRTCCTEPFLNMLFQKAVGAFIEYRLRRHFGISLKVQAEFNKELARLGSIDGSFGTIDSTSASDSIQWSLIEQLLSCNPTLLGLMRACRSEITELPSGEKLRLKMVSTMGNGFTFPLQTLLFACAVRSVYKLMGFSSACSRSQYGVFGDDVIVRREAYNCVVSLLKRIGFEVNEGKSFNTGYFRESCGFDAFRGRYVRGVYITSLESISDVYSAINRLNLWSARNGIRLRRTVKELCSFLKKPHYIPPSDGDTEGLKVPFDLTVPKVSANYWFSYRKLVSKQKTRKVPTSAEEAREFGYQDFNPDGWITSLLGGYTRGDEFSYKLGPDGEVNLPNLADARLRVNLRQYPGERTQTKVVGSSIPFWDWHRPIENETLRPHLLYSHCSWKAAVTGNLFD